ncbi:MAG: hypothetical protein ACI9BH_002786 [Paracoccaceae bacterium]|jgi:hypothetical protein
MTTTRDPMSMVVPEIPYVETRLPIKLNHGGCAAFVTIVFRVCGTALILMAPALWILRGSTVSSDLVVMKAGITLFFFLCGLALLMRNHADAQPEIYFDPIRREIRVLRTKNRGRPETILRRSYDTLGAANITKRAVELWDVDGSILMGLSLPDAKSRQALRMHFSGLLRVTEQ